MFLSTEIFSKRRKIFSWIKEKPEWHPSAGNSLHYTNIYFKAVSTINFDMHATVSRYYNVYGNRPALVSVTAVPSPRTFIHVNWVYITIIIKPHVHGFGIFCCQHRRAFFLFAYRGMYVCTLVHKKYR